eukprot:scaffold52091_cov71-Phaeocystis_antarctica.AAC.3
MAATVQQLDGQTFGHIPRRHAQRRRADQAVVLDDAPQHRVSRVAAERTQRLQVRRTHHPQPRQLPRHVGQAVHYVHVVVVRPRQQQPHLARAALQRRRAPLALLPVVATRIPVATNHVVPPPPLAGGASPPVLHPYLILSYQGVGGATFFLFTAGAGGMNDASRVRNTHFTFKHLRKEHFETCQWFMTAH